MQQAAVTVQRRPKRHPVPTDSRQRYRVAPNLLARQCDVAQPQHVWAGDITYVWTAEGWLYVAVLLDVYSRKSRLEQRYIDDADWAGRPLDKALGFVPPRKRVDVQVLWFYFYTDRLVKWGRPNDWPERPDKILEIRQR
jgi:hypothetical protein